MGVSIDQGQATKSNRLTKQSSRPGILAADLDIMFPQKQTALRSYPPRLTQGNGGTIGGTSGAYPAGLVRIRPQQFVSDAAIL